MYILPEWLKKAVNELPQARSLQSLMPFVKSLHEKYTSLRTIKKLEPEEALAYCLYRLPATYASLQYLFDTIEKQGVVFSPTSLLEFGCGPGTSYFALKEKYPLMKEALCIDHSEHFLSLFRTLAEKAHMSLPTLIHQGSQSVQLPDRTWDVGVLSYILGEIEESEQVRMVEKMLSHCQHVLIVEPGTPAGFSNILRARKAALAQGFQILAPCPHSMECPMQKTKTWCHVRVRLERPHFQQKMKDATLSYEDEALCYLILYKGKSFSTPRVVDHPQKRKGHMHLSLCQSDGELKKIVVSKKRGDLYTRSKELLWGDQFCEETPHAE
jgi:ribosomal protein RSM22 (predicted rRNA methylase)